MMKRENHPFPWSGLLKNTVPELKIRQMYSHILFYKDGEPIGFIQYYIQDEITIGLDMWIGILKGRNNGYGASALKQMVQLIHKKHPHVKELFIDPEVENKRAVRCYQNAGFKNFGTIIDEEGDPCLLLKICFEE